MDISVVDVAEASVKVTPLSSQKRMVTMIHPLVAPDRFIMPPNTISHLAGPLGGLPWKTAKQAFEQYCLTLASGTRIEEVFAQAEEEIRPLLARQVAGTPQDVSIAFALNVTEALIKLLDCIETFLDPHDNVITPSTAYPSLRLLTKSLRKRRGMQLRQPEGTTDAVIAAIDERTRLIIIEEFDTRSCEMLDLARIADVAHAVGARLVVDASQLIGIFPLDFRHFDAAVATAYKGLNGASNGCTPIFLNRARWQPGTIQPSYAGRNSVQVESEEDFLFKDDPGARLQPGGLNWLGIFLLLDSLRNMQRLHLELEDIAQHILGLTTEIVLALKELARANDQLTLNIIAGKNPLLRGPHVTIKMLRERAKLVCKRLEDRNIYLSYDSTGLRLGPRVHNSSTDVERAVEQLGEVLLELGYNPLDPTWVVG
jgi:selenocysteine lyase/cysteine desulfurase